jgi:hypothetical protein
MDIHKRENYDISFIQSLIDNGIEESINIDFKASGALSKEDSKKKEISKDVSAFANANGGIIIYGLTEKNHKADSFSFIDGNVFTKEWLEQVISTTIQRGIEGLKIFPIRHNGNINESIYVVQIPESNDAPHISRDKKYYKRYDFQSVLLEECDIRNMYGRKSKSELVIARSLVRLEEKIFDGYKFKLIIAIQNIGDIQESLYKVNTYFHEYVPDKLLIEWDNREKQKKYNHIHIDVNRVKISANSTETIFSNELVNVSEFCFVVKDEYIIDSFEKMKIEVRLFYSGGEDKMDVNFDRSILD